MCSWTCCAGLQWMCFWGSWWLCCSMCKSSRRRWFTVCVAVWKHVCPCEADGAKYVAWCVGNECFQYLLCKYWCCCIDVRWRYTALLVAVHHRVVGACVLIAGEDVRDYNDARTSALACLAIELCMSFLLIYLVLSAFLFACMSFALIPGILLSSLTMWSNMPFPTCEPKDVMENLAFAHMPSMFLKMTKVLLYCLHENAASRLSATTCRCMLESLLAFATSVPFLPEVLQPSVSANGFDAFWIVSSAAEHWRTDANIRVNCYGLLQY